VFPHQLLAVPVKPIGKGRAKLARGTNFLGAREMGSLKL